MGNLKAIAIAVLLLSLSAAAEDLKVQAAQSATAGGNATLEDQIVDRIIEREHATVQNLRDYTPIVETYLQNMRTDEKLGSVPAGDRYFLGRLDMSQDVSDRSFLGQPGFWQRFFGHFGNLYTIQYKPIGFSWMVFVDRSGFDRNHYDFKFERREFLGDVRCLVFSVFPRKGSGTGRFLGRIWVEDQNYNIVRFNGTYAPHARNNYFFHMDSWRVNEQPGMWLPTFVYSEESDMKLSLKRNVNFKAQTRIWGYDLRRAGNQQELTEVLVDSTTVKDQSDKAQDSSPIESMRQWDQQAENNVLEKLETAGLLSPEGEVDKILQTVVNNLMITNNLNIPPVHTRVLMTTPMETFHVGHTIIVSRGLVDVLPDEASLAMVLSHELAHIVLGHQLGSKYAFSDRILFSDEYTYQKLGFHHDAHEEQEADQRALDFLKHSPYADKLPAAALFLKQLSVRAGDLTALLTPHLGNSLGQDGHITRMADLVASSPALEPDKLDQIAALPLGGRIRVDPWNDQLTLVKTQAVALYSPREKVPFEVTPFFPHLTRVSLDVNAATTTEISAPQKQ